jgi:hypothetical protein
MEPPYNWTLMFEFKVCHVGCHVTLPKPKPKFLNKRLCHVPCLGRKLCHVPSTKYHVSTIKPSKLP